MKGGYTTKDQQHSYRQGFPVISVITVVYNSEQFIERTLKSIQSQTYPNIEHIIVDGLSKDRTLEIVQNYEEKIALWISEKDKGIYDAMNKGQQLATGDYLLFLNSGDEFYSGDTLEKIFTQFPVADVYYGDTEMTSVNGEPIGQRRLRPPQHLEWRSLRHGMIVCHQSFIVRRTLAESYDITYRISADIDWVIRCLKNAGKVVNTNLTISKFMEGGMSTTSMRKGLIERYEILKKHFGFTKNILNHTYITFRLLKHLLLQKKG